MQPNKHWIGEGENVNDLKAKEGEMWRQEIVRKDIHI